MCMHVSVLVCVCIGVCMCACVCVHTVVICYSQKKKKQINRKKLGKQVHSRRKKCHRREEKVWKIYKVNMDVKFCND